VYNIAVFLGFAFLVSFQLVIVRYSVCTVIPLSHFVVEPEGGKICINDLIKP
jgi:hypothetical protein